MEKYQLQERKQITINTDPLKRCYNGVNFSQGKGWSQWDTIHTITKEKIDETLKWWQDLNQYSISIGGKEKQYRVVKIEN